MSMQEMLPIILKDLQKAQLITKLKQLKMNKNSRSRMTKIWSPTTSRMTMMTKMTKTKATILIPKCYPPNPMKPQLKMKLADWVCLRERFHCDRESFLKRSPPTKKIIFLESSFSMLVLFPPHFAFTA